MIVYRSQTELCNRNSTSQLGVNINREHYVTACVYTSDIDMSVSSRHLI